VPEPVPPTAADPRPEDEASTIRRRSTVGRYVRYRGWAWVIGGLLVLLGLGNIYPFWWMMATSLKSKSEASTDLDNPIPRQKFHLTEAGRAFARDSLSTLNLAQLRGLAVLETDHEILGEPQVAQTPPRTWAQRYAVQTSAAAEDAARDLAELHRVGLLTEAAPAIEYRFTDTAVAGTRPADVALPPTLGGLLREAAERRLAAPDAPPMSFSDARYAREAGLDLAEAHRRLAAFAEAGVLREPDVQSPAYRLSETGRAPLALVDGVGLSARQALVLRTLAAEDAKRKASAETFVPFSLTSDEAAQTSLLIGKVGATGVGAATAAEVQRESAAALARLADAGLLATQRFQWINYWIVFTDMRFYLKVATSLALTAGVVVLTLLITSMFGYAMARLQFPGKVWLLMLLIAGAVAPSEAVIIPIFRLLQSLGLLEGLWGMVIWMSGVGVGNALLMAGFFLTLPKEVEEAARVDGAGPFRTFFDVALPMARPIVMTIGLFAFLGAWNNFLIPFLATQAQPNMQPLAVAVYSAQQQYQGEWQLITGAAAIMIIPVILLFLLLQKHIVNSIAVGAVKG